MKKLFLLFSLLLVFVLTNAQHGQHAQPDTSWTTIYRETPRKINNLVHTRLDVQFDYNNAYLIGKAWITLKPHFYPTDSLTLDAKGMDIKKVTLVKGSNTPPLKYEYDGMELKIRLDKKYTYKETYTIFIDYVAKPNEYKGKGSAAITDAKGLYFINPKGEIKDKPIQIWTQGETEATSVWCPTIDKPNQKTTQEIAMTVPDKFVTLSNGKLTAQKKNGNGTRTDTWKMDLPHAPYLFFMGVGDYAIIKDNYKGKEVSYYVEKEYAAVARKIFGNTPEMLSFFSKLLGIEYPWNKYAQIVGRDYVSGAMENTTAVLHQESAQQDARELIDENVWEGTIAHELFHHWFGNYVTAESWSNLTINESFANYSQVLWKEYKYGKDAGDEENYSDMFGYIQSQSEDKNLVRYYYKDKEAMFDAVSYNKGGRILHMLRNYVGDSAFFKSLNLFLTQNKYGTAEATQLRLAFEQITGKDLNWFWNQWYFSNGHPKLDISYIYDEDKKVVKVVVKQLQEEKTFILPIAVDIYNGANSVRHNVWLEKRTDTLQFSYTTKPDLVNVDGDKILLAEKTDKKTLENYIHQYKYAGKFLDRKEAVDYAIQSDDSKAIAFLKEAVKDKFSSLRSYTISKINWKDPEIAIELEPVIMDIGKNDPKSLVRASAINILTMFADNKYKDIFIKGVNDSSYSVAGASLEGLYAIDSTQAYQLAKKMSEQNIKGKLTEAVTKIILASGDESGFALIAKTFGKLPTGQAKFNLVVPFGQMLAKINDPEKVKKGVDLIAAFRDDIPAEYGIAPYINNLLNSIADRKTDQEVIDYIKSKTN